MSSNLQDDSSDDVILGRGGFFFFKCMCLFRERERECEWERGRGRERIPSRLRAVNMEPDVGLDPVNPDIVT